MMAMPSTVFPKTQMANDVHFLFGRVRILVKAVVRVDILVTETFGTKAWPKEVVAKMHDVTLQR
jgi:hypothetical protein